MIELLFWVSYVLIGLYVGYRSKNWFFDGRVKANFEALQNKQHLLEIKQHNDDFLFGESKKAFTPKSDDELFAEAYRMTPKTAGNGYGIFAIAVWPYVLIVAVLGYGLTCLERLMTLAGTKISAKSSSAKRVAEIKDKKKAMVEITERIREAQELNMGPLVISTLEGIKNTMKENS